MAKVAVVTGGASGMGRIYALRMAEQGYQVAIVDRTEQALDEVASLSENIHRFCCDVTQLEQVETVIQNVNDTLGPIHRLVHCAAIMPTGKLPEQPIEPIQQLMAVNYGGTVNMVKTVLSTMQTGAGGEIVIFGSLGGYVPVADCGAYCATKAAVNSFAETLIEETRGSNVHVMVICPPLVNTPLLQQATQTSNPKTIRYSIEHKRFADPEKIIDAVERGLLQKSEILFPGAEAKILHWLRRFSPKLVWRIINTANRE